MIDLSVSEINIYPVKSLGGIQLDQATLTKRGFEYDRNWMVVTSGGQFVTQRQIPQMSAIKVTLTGTDLILSAYGKTDLKLNLETGSVGTEAIEVTIHGKRASGINEGREVSVWLTDVLGKYKDQDLLLVRFPVDQKRVVDPEFLGSRTEHTAFADAYPLLVTFEGSLDELNRRLEENGSRPVTMDRFRPNLVVRGSSPFSEDNFSELNIGEHVRIELVRPCTRCPITTVDQKTGNKPEPKEPLKTLSEFRKKDGGVTFGVYAIIVEGEGQTVTKNEIIKKIEKFN